MGKERLLAFSDGVIAIIITIMVLEMHAPEDPHFSAILKEWHTFVAYVLSFINVGIYWNNHHHLLLAARRVNGAILWANLVLLFFLSLLPFATAWLGRTDFAAAPTAFYGVALLCPAISYYVLQTLLLNASGPNSMLAQALRSDWKGKLSPLAYVAGVGVAFAAPAVSLGLYMTVALIWLIPDPRVERLYDRAEASEDDHTR